MKIDFKTKQSEFVAYIKDPFNNPVPSNVAESRMAVYRELFFNNIDNFLSSNFPVLRAILDDSQWFELAQDFFSRHACHSPYFSGIPEEFINFLQEERNNPRDFPFLLELAHYEWVEMALSIAKEDSVCNHRIVDNWLTQTVQLSSLAWPLVYQYPVHKIAPSFLPIQLPTQPTFLVAYRNSLDDVGFIEITPITYQLLNLIEAHQGIVIADCLEQISTQLQHSDPDIINSAGLTIIKQLAEKNIIILLG